MWSIKKVLWKRRVIVGCGVVLFLLLLVTISLFGKQPRNNENYYSALTGNGFQENSAKQQYVVVFFDDFDEDEVDRSVWTFHSQENPAFGGRYKSRFKTNEKNVYIDQGCLILDCSKSADLNDGTYRKSNGEEAPVEYLAPYISTCDELAMSEGRISARIKVSKGIEDGVFPFCFWTFGQNSEWPCAHEMDIMEASAGVSLEDRKAKNGTMIPAGSHLSTFAAHLHVRTSETPDLFNEHFFKLNWTLYNQGVYDRSINFINKVDPTEWHVYSVEWEKDSLKYLVDGISIIKYDAKTLGVINANGDIGFFYPQDIRFNIKAGEKTIDEHGYMYVDWVKAESKLNIPCLSISHADINLNVGGSIYINPTFNTGCSNKAFSISVEDDGILGYEKYLNDGSQMVAHRIVAKKTGETIVTLRSANGNVVNTFKVTVI